MALTKFPVRPDINAAIMSIATNGLAAWDMASKKTPRRFLAIIVFFPKTFCLCLTSSIESPFSEVSSFDSTCSLGSVARL